LIDIPVDDSADGILPASAATIHMKTFISLLVITLLLSQTACSKPDPDTGSIDAQMEKLKATSDQMRAEDRAYQAQQRGLDAQIRAQTEELERNLKACEIDPSCPPDVEAQMRETLSVLKNNP
jgi:hypothetical protein